MGTARASGLSYFINCIIVILIHSTHYPSIETHHKTTPGSDSRESVGGEGRGGEGRKMYITTD
jgi:hypothetical protein